MLDNLTERHLAAIALVLGAPNVTGWSAAEDALTRDLPRIPRDTLRAIRRRLEAGTDPLGAAFCRVRTPEARRPQGATYTPKPIVRAMLRCAATYCPRPARIIDPGVGSARFLVLAGRRFPDTRLIGIDIDPLATMLACANLTCAGFADRSEIIVGDYRNLSLPAADGRTLYLGNPPYVRHHLIASAWKAWLTKAAATLRLPDVSQLAGLHVHFFLATALQAKTGDVGVSSRRRNGWT